MMLLCVALATAAAATPLVLFIAAFWLVAWRRRPWVRI
jgi:hypothetical protein